jgi:protein-S-isoprenylcysteine O-methyltransferase Ste14
VKKIHINKKRLGTIAHYGGVVCEYFIVIFFAIWLNNILKIPNLFFFPLKIFGLILIALGIILTFWTSWLQFKIGKGTTGFSEPTKKLVTCGPYGIVRNPMMEGQFFFFSGIGFLLDLLSMFIILPLLILAIHAFTVFIEEPNLKRRFEQNWIKYCNSVPRWFPRFRRTRNNSSKL